MSYSSQPRWSLAFAKRKRIRHEETLGRYGAAVGELSLKAAQEKCIEDDGILGEARADRDRD
jgi:hypothetical protein